MTNNSSNNDKPYSYTAMCSWIGNGEMCSASSAQDSSYCVEHYGLVYKLGSGKQRKKDTRTAEKVRLVQQLMQEAIDQLEMEGFDVYGDSEREKVLDLDVTED
jgi:alpha-tubulin suppressor-like RCC1 family protein